MAKNERCNLRKAAKTISDYCVKNRCFGNGYELACKCIFYDKEYKNCKLTEDNLTVPAYWGNEL